MHYYDDEQVNHNQIAVVVYWHDNDRFPYVTSIVAVSMVTPWMLNEVLGGLKYSLPEKVKELDEKSDSDEFIEFERDRYYYVDLRVIEDADYEILEFTDVTDHPNPVYRLH